jgi:hypothetical protein
MQAFLGLFNFYRRFVPAAASILKPLTDSLQGSPKGKQRLNWSATMKTAFAAARSALATRRCWTILQSMLSYPWFLTPQPRT